MKKERILQFYRNREERVKKKIKKTNFVYFLVLDLKEY
jgi:hypothetical protein